jgi:hypothetical protein
MCTDENCPVPECWNYKETDKLLFEIYDYYHTLSPDFFRVFGSRCGFIHPQPYPHPRNPIFTGINCSNNLINDHDTFYFMNMHTLHFQFLSLTLFEYIYYQLEIFVI